MGSRTCFTCLGTREEKGDSRYGDQQPDCWYCLAPGSIGQETSNDQQRRANICPFPVHHSWRFVHSPTYRTVPQLCHTSKCLDQRHYHSCTQIYLPGF